MYQGITLMLYFLQSYFPAKIPLNSKKVRINNDIFIKNLYLSYGLIIRRTGHQRIYPYFGFVTPE